MPVRVAPPAWHSYPSLEAARAAWTRGEPFRVLDRWHPDFDRQVTCHTLKPPVTVLAKAPAGE